MVAVGIDLVRCARVAWLVARYDKDDLGIVFTQGELDRAGQHRHQITALAVCLAAKEAVAKALGCGIGPIGWTEVEAQVDLGAIRLALHGRAARLAEDQGLSRWVAAWTDLGGVLLVCVFADD